MRALYSFVIDADDKFYPQTLVFLKSLISTGVDPSQIVANYTPTASSRCCYLAASFGVTLSPLEPYLDGKYCNKINQLSGLLVREADVYVLCDTDLAFVDAIDDLFRTARVRAKPVDLPNPPIDVLERLRARASVTQQPRIVETSCDAQPTWSVNCNGGLYIIPHALAASLDRAWRREAARAFASQDILGQWHHHADQIGFAMAMLSCGYDIEEIPVEFNFPMHLGGYFGKFSFNIPSVLHFHLMLDGDGFLQETGDPLVDVAISRVNTLMREPKAAPSARPSTAGNGQALTSFDPHYYLSVYHDVAAAGIDPFEHWIHYGISEGRHGVPPKIRHAPSVAMHENDTPGWERGDFHFHVISMPNSTRRRDRISENLTRNRINYTFHNGLDGDEIETISNSFICRPVSIPMVYNRRTSPLSYKELACTLSHLRAIRSAYLRGYQGALICEDDIMIGDVSAFEISYIIRNMPANASFIQFCVLPEPTVSRLARFYIETKQMFLEKSQTEPIYFNDEKFIDYSCHSTGCYFVTLAGMRNICDNIFDGERAVLPCSDLNVLSMVALVADNFIYKAGSSKMHRGYTCTYPTFTVEAIDSFIHPDHVESHRAAATAVETWRNLIRREIDRQAWGD